MRKILRPALPALLLAALSGCAGAAALPAPAPAPAATLRSGLDSIFGDTAFALAHWGVLVRSLDTGETLYARDPERAFVPASNMKLVTGAAALETLGPDYRFRTDFLAAGQVRDGALRGTLVVRGTGDPTLSERFFPGDARAAMRAWADSLRAHGITRIAGPIVGVDSAFAGAHLGAGWTWDDLDYYYASEFGALQFNEGAVEVTVFPSREVGNPGVVVLDPPTQYVTVNNQTVTVARGQPTRVTVQRDEVGPGIVVSGQVAADSSAGGESVAVRDPTLYFLHTLRETLREAGISVEGPALDADDLPLEDLSVRRASPVFTYRSAPLREVLAGMMKPSQNWIAETLLRATGREARGEGSARAGGAVADSLLRARGVDTRALRVADGSGLSRSNLLSPVLLTGLLEQMARSPNWETWYASMAVAGEDGTLARRMRGTPLAGNVHAKTGTLTGVRSLSGYLTTAAGERIVFSMMVNNHLRSAAAADAVMDAALARIHAGPR